MQSNTDISVEAAAAEVAPTSLDPYGQLLKMLLPRALNIALYDRAGQLLWTADGCESDSLRQLVEDEIAHQLIVHEADVKHCGTLHNLDGENAYVFPLRTHDRLQGVAVIISGGQAARSVENTYSLLRPALEVLTRELDNQYSLELLHKDLKARDGDLALLMGEGGTQLQNTDDFNALLQNCIHHLQCPLGAVLIPDKNIALYRTDGVPPSVGAEVLSRTHRHLLALTQVQRHTVVLNKPITAGPMANLSYKVLACPVYLYQGTQHVAGVLAIFKPIGQADFSLREIRIVELLARRITNVLQNAYDHSTGLLTRPALEKRANAVLEAGKKDQAHFVIYVDIDRLHVINETFGMHVGDEVITRIADVIRTNLRPSMAASRISGDRFTLFLPNIDVGAAHRLADNLCQCILNLDYRVGDKRVQMSASFGVSPLQASEHPLSHALASAEAACKAAKDRGRGRVEIYQDADHSIIRRVEDVTMIGSLREAIEHDRFRMDAQPVVELHPNGQRQHFELLIRMLDPSGELIPPSKFLTAAERYQLAPAIDRWVVNYVLELLSAGAPRLLSVGAQFAVNISGQSLGDDEFRVYLEGQLREYALPPSLLSFEVTETAAVSNIVRAETLIRNLRKLGHEVALDDFGRGLSSLTYLKSLPVNCVKIDGELIRDVTHNPRSQAMITAVVQLARAMKLQTTAECIESEEIYEVIAGLGVDYAQGFAIGKPRPLEIVLNELITQGTTTGIVKKTIGALQKAG